MYNENPHVVKMLIDAGADVNAKGLADWRPLHFAVWNRFNSDVVKVLIQAGADPNVRNNKRNTPLGLAARYTVNSDVVKVLTQAGTDPNVRVYNVNEALGLAARYNDNPDVVKVLLAAGADPNATIVNKWTPLHMAAGYNPNSDVVKVLLAAGADPNATNVGKWTPLHSAAGHNEDPAVVQILLDAGANLQARNDDGDTPLDKAEQVGNYAAARLLASAGAVRTVKSQSTPKKKGTDWGKVAVGVLGGAAIIHAGKDAPKEVVDQALTDWVNVLSERQSTTNAPTSAGASGGAASQDQMHQALQNLENICGEKYQSGFAANDHYRFYCMAAFNDHCALKRAQTEDARTKLRASLAQNCGVLHGIGAAGKCTYCQ